MEYHGLSLTQMARNLVRMQFYFSVAHRFDTLMFNPTFQKELDNWNGWYKRKRLVLEIKFRRYILHIPFDASVAQVGYYMHM